MSSRASFASGPARASSSSGPPCTSAETTFVRKGTAYPRNSPQRFCSSPRSFFQYCSIAARSYTRGSPPVAAPPSRAARASLRRPISSAAESSIAT